MLHSLTLGATVLLGAGICAQSVTTIPQGFGTTEAGYSRHVPLRYNPARIQCGYGAKATGWTAPQVINELWARADGGKHLTTGFTVECEVLLSSDGCDVETKSNTFATNHGKDVKVFMKRVQMSFTAFAAAPSPAPFTVQLKGDAPFVATKPTLLVDWKVYSKSNQLNDNFYLDADDVTGTGQGTKGSNTYIGTACNPTNFYSYATGLNEGELFRPYCYTRNGGDWVVHWIGAAQVNVPIPGQPGCTLYTTPTFLYPMVQQTSGTSALYFDWAVIPKGLGGAKVITQFAAWDSTFSQMRWSRATETTFGDYKLIYPYVLSHKYNYASGSSTFDPDKDDARYGWVDTAIIFEVK